MGIDGGWGRSSDLSPRYACPNRHVTFISLFFFFPTDSVRFSFLFMWKKSTKISYELNSCEKYSCVSWHPKFGNFQRKAIPCRNSGSISIHGNKYHENVSTYSEIHFHVATIVYLKINQTYSSLNYLFNVHRCLSVQERNIIFAPFSIFSYLFKVISLRFTEVEWKIHCFCQVMTNKILCQDCNLVKNKKSKQITPPNLYFLFVAMTMRKDSMNIQVVAGIYFSLIRPKFPWNSVSFFERFSSDNGRSGVLFSRVCVCARAFRRWKVVARPFAAAAGRSHQQRRTHSDNDGRQKSKNEPAERKKETRHMQTHRRREEKSPRDDWRWCWRVCVTSHLCVIWRTWRCIKTAPSLSLLLCVCVCRCRCKLKFFVVSSVRATLKGKIL